MFYSWIKKLSDKHGEYEIFIKCEGCGHSRTASPKAFVSRLGPNGLLSELKARLRCSKCQAKDVFINLVGRPEDSPRRK